MKALTVAVVALLLSAASTTIYAQVVPAATQNHIRLAAGGLGSVFQPDYAGQGIAETSPNRLYGPGFYVDYRVTRWVQLEGEGRFLDFNQYLGINQHTYLIGPRVPIATYHGLTPYGKFLVGLGSGNFLEGHTLVLAYGGGVDYRLTKKLTLRCIDFEYQQWKLTPALSPYGGSIGIAYKIF